MDLQALLAADPVLARTIGRALAGHGGRTHFLDEADGSDRDEPTSNDGKESL